MMPSYLDFELEIGDGLGRDYPVAVLRSPAGETQATMRFPFDELQLESRLKDLQIALLRSGGKRRTVLTREEQAVQDLGRALFDALMAGEVRSLYDVSKARAAEVGQGLRVKLRIAAPTLAALPWEYLYDSRLAEYVCLSVHTPVVRYLELPRPPQPLAVTPPLRVLGLIASPGDLPVLDVANERERVEVALAEVRAKGLVELEWLAGQTWRDLQRAMRGGPWHVFHFVGHGAFDANADEGLVMLSDERGRARPLRATELGRLLADHRALRLTVLNACEGARGGDRDIFSSTASILVRQGLPAVLAMQYDITDRAAVELARAFYESVAEGLPVDAALAEARKAVSLAVTNTMEWGTPVLYMRAPDGVLFDLEGWTAPAVAPPAAPAVEPAPVPAVEPLAVPATAPAAGMVEMALEAVPAGGVAPERALEPEAGETPRRRPKASMWLLIALAGALLVAIAIFAAQLGGGQPEEQILPSPPAPVAGAGGATPTAAPAAPIIGETFIITAPVRMELVRVPEGEFLMGSDPDQDPQATSDEEPQHQVNLPEFAIGRTEVTNAQYAAFVAATGHAAPAGWPDGRILPGREEHPVAGVSWQDARAFAEWLGDATGLGCRLPTEAEWEKACRGTDGRIYPWGDAQWSLDRVNYGRATLDTTPVGSYSPQGDSATGAADMGGNVMEWTTTAYTSYPYDAGDGREDPATGVDRVIRGGSFMVEVGAVRCAYRNGGDPSEYADRLGFRVVCETHTPAG